MAKKLMVLDFSFRCCTLSNQESWVPFEAHEAKISALLLRLVSSKSRTTFVFRLLSFFSSGVCDHSYTTESLDHVSSTKKMSLDFSGHFRTGYKQMREKQTDSSLQCTLMHWRSADASAAITTTLVVSLAVAIWSTLSNTDSNMVTIDGWAKPWLSWNRKQRMQTMSFSSDIIAAQRIQNPVARVFRGRAYAVVLPAQLKLETGEGKQKSTLLSRCVSSESRTCARVRVFSLVCYTSPKLKTSRDAETDAPYSNVYGSVDSLRNEDRLSRNVILARRLLDTRRLFERRR